MNFYPYKTTGIVMMGMMLCSVGFAQEKSQEKSYESRLSEIANQKSNHELGTISGQDKKELQKKELVHAYSYVPKENISEIKKEPVQKQSLNSEYFEFRKKHNIPDYIGNDAVKDAIKKSKDDKVKEEAVKIVEAEKLLFDSYSAFHKEKDKTELEQGLIKAAGIKEPKNKDKGIEKDMETRIDILGKQTSSILKTSIDKLVKADAIDEKDVRSPQYMASGGRVFPGLEFDEDKDLLNMRGQVLAKVQRELMAVMANAINQHYHKEQGETAKEEIKSKDQLLAFVRVDEKAEVRQTVHEERMQALMHFIEQIEKDPQSGYRYFKDFNPQSLQSIKSELTSLRSKNISDIDVAHLYETLEKSGAVALFATSWSDPLRADLDPSKMTNEQIEKTLQDASKWDQIKRASGMSEHSFKTLNAEETAKLNDSYKKEETDGKAKYGSTFRPGVDFARLSFAEKQEYEQAKSGWEKSYGGKPGGPDSDMEKFRGEYLKRTGKNYYDDPAKTSANTPSLSDQKAYEAARASGTDMQFRQDYQDRTGQNYYEAPANGPGNVPDSHPGGCNPCN